MGKRSRALRPRAVASPFRQVVGVAFDSSVMEAATPLRQAHVAVLSNRLVIDGLVVEDPTAVEVVRRREEAGEDPARVVASAVEIGARVLEREQTGAQADFVRAEFEKTSREVSQNFTESSRVVAQFLNDKVNEAFAPESGHVMKALEKHFSDDSSMAVQNRVQAVIREALQSSREDLIKQFSSADASNPLAQFQRMVLASMKQSSETQGAQLLAMVERMAALEVELTKLRGEAEKSAEVAAEADRGTAKGRTFEEAVFEAIDDIARAQGDDCDAVGDERGAGGRKGDAVIAIDGACGPARGRIVIEAKNSRDSKKVAVEYLDEALRTRDAEYAVWVVPSEDKLPKGTSDLREVGGDKLFVVYDPKESPLALELAYKLGRARVLMARGSDDKLDGTALRGEVDRALGAMENTRRIKQQLTAAKTGIEEARKILESMDDTVRSHLGRIDQLLAPIAEQPLRPLFDVEE